MDERLLRIIFAGTPEFAAIALQALIDENVHEIIAVYTQPDRKSGRGQKISYSAVKEVAVAHQLPVYQPLHFKSKTEDGLASQAELIALNADVMIVAAYGLILPKAVLEAPKYGCLNIHGSLLPKYRGAAPIQRAIEAQEHQTGVTIMKMDIGLDTGDMIVKTICPIETADTSASIHDKLAHQGADAILKVLKTESILNEYLAQRIPQDESQATYAHKLTKAEAQINWAQSATQIHANIRAFNPWPIAFIAHEEINLRVWSATYSKIQSKLDAVPGEILAIDQDGVHVSCHQQQVICINILQWPGAKPFNPQQIQQTNKLHVGQVLI